MIIELAEKLLEKKTLGLKEIEAVLGKRPFEPKGSFKAYLEEVKSEEDEKLSKQEATPEPTESDNKEATETPPVNPANPI